MKPVNAIPFPFNLIRALKAESIKLERLLRRRPQLAMCFTILLCNQPDILCCEYNYMQFTGIGREDLRLLIGKYSSS